MTLLQLAFKSMASRKLVVFLLTLSMGLSTMLLIGVQKIKQSARYSFSHSISGTDLIVGARSGDIQLLMYTVFHVGRPVSNMSMNAVSRLKNLKHVDWVVPVSLGDSHKGYAVVGTTQAYFDKFRYGRKKHITFQKGQEFDGVFDVVIGSEVAKALGYGIGSQIYLSHGMSRSSLTIHDNKVFTVRGVLNPTHSPIDKSVFVSLEGIEALHVDWKNGVAPSPGKSLGNQDIEQLSLTPSSVTGAFVGLKSRLSVFYTQRQIVDKFREPLSAIIPGVALAQLWQTMSTVDDAFLVITILVMVIAFIGLMLALFMSLNQRQREMALLRSMGCRPWQIFLLLTLESLMITSLGVGLGLMMMVGGGQFIAPLLESKMGLALALNTLALQEWLLALAIILFGLLVSIVPAFKAYRKSISESLTGP